MIKWLFPRSPWIQSGHGTFYVCSLNWIYSIFSCKWIQQVPPEQDSDRAGSSKEYQDDVRDDPFLSYLACLLMCGVHQ